MGMVCEKVRVHVGITGHSSFSEPAQGSSGKCTNAREADPAGEEGTEDGTFERTRNEGEPGEAADLRASD